MNGAAAVTGTAMGKRCWQWALLLLLCCAPPACIQRPVGASQVPTVRDDGLGDGGSAAPSSVDFIDLDGDVVVAPFRWQVLNVDEAIKQSTSASSNTLVVLIFVNDELAYDFLLDGGKKLSVGFSGAENLAPGEYDVTIKLADAASGGWTGEQYYLFAAPSLLGIDSPTRKLIVESDKGSFREHPAFLAGHGACAQHSLTLLGAFESDQLSHLEALTRSWPGPISAAIFVSAAEQAEAAIHARGRGGEAEWERGGVPQVDAMDQLRELHQRFDVECLTISLLLETRESASRTKAPYHRLYNLAHAQASSRFVLLVPLGVYPSASLWETAGQGRGEKGGGGGSKLGELWEEARQQIRTLKGEVALVVPLVHVRCGQEGVGGEGLARIGWGGACEDRDWQAQIRAGPAGGQDEPAGGRRGRRGGVEWEVVLPASVDADMWSGVVSVEGDGGTGTAGVFEMDFEPHMTPFLAVPREAFPRFDGAGVNQHQFLETLSYNWVSSRNKFAVVNGMYMYDFHLEPSAAEKSGGALAAARQSLPSSHAQAKTKAALPGAGGRADDVGAGAGAGRGGGPRVSRSAAASEESGAGAGLHGNRVGAGGQGVVGKSGGPPGELKNVDMGYQEVPCRIKLYGGLFMPNFVLRLLEGMPGACGCRFELTAFPDDPTGVIAPHSVVVIGHHLHERKPLDAAVAPALRTLRRMYEANQHAALGSIGLFYLGDDTMQFPLDWEVLEALAWVYHQHWRPDLRRGKQDFSYLLGLGDLARAGGGATGSLQVHGAGGVTRGVHWLPVGPAHTWRPFDVIDVDTGNRTYLFSFMDKVASRYAGEMVDALLGDANWDKLRHRGVLKAFQGTDTVWNQKILDPHHFVPILRAQLYQSAYAPCPGGAHHETARVWEALEAGAIPILAHHPDHGGAENEILAALDLGIVFLDSWAELPAFLLSVSESETAARASKLRQEYARFKAAMGSHLMRAVCQLKA